jgi:hypothetical protein
VLPYTRSDPACPRIVTTILALAVSACASSSEDISPSYVSPVTYQNFSCEQLGEEAQRVSQQAAIASGQQDKARTSDAIVTTVGVVVFWPALFFIDGDGPKAAELARLKGQMDAIEGAAILKKCRISFKKD